jgi:hypothetical protein
MDGSVRIFWGIREPDHSWTILIDSTSLTEAEPYGDFLTPPGGHEEWSNCGSSTLWPRMDGGLLRSEPTGCTEGFIICPRVICPLPW